MLAYQIPSFRDFVSIGDLSAKPYVPPVLCGKIKARRQYFTAEKGEAEFARRNVYYRRVEYKNVMRFFCHTLPGLLLLLCYFSSNAQDERYEYQTEPFRLLKRYPRITDTSGFIRELKRNCHLYEDGIHPAFDKSQLKESINYFKKIKLNGDSDDYYLLEYDWHGNIPNTQFPWKRQFLFDSHGKLVKIMAALKTRLLTIFLHQPPFLVITKSTAHGNGGHEIYGVHNGVFMNLFGGFRGNRPQTFTTNEGPGNDPDEFLISVEDKNHDGYNDVVFSGHIIYWSNDTGKARSVPAQFIFLFNPASGKFLEKENYAEKFAFIYGNTIR